MCLRHWNRTDSIQRARRGSAGTQRREEMERSEDLLIFLIGPLMIAGTVLYTVVLYSTVVP
jgi:hypothetical protein